MSMTRKEYLKQYYSKKIECPNCKNLVRNGSLKRHQETKKCLNFHRKDEIIKERKERKIKSTKEWIKNNPDKCKKYREDNKEKMKEYEKKYYEDNKEKIKEYKNEKILCKVCNCNVRRGDISRHKKTKKHFNNLNKND